MRRQTTTTTTTTTTKGERLLAVSGQRVRILVNEATDHITHAAGKVLDDKRLARRECETAALAGPRLLQLWGLAEVVAVDALQVSFVLGLRHAADLPY